MNFLQGNRKYFMMKPQKGITILKWLNKPNLCRHTCSSDRSPQFYVLHWIYEVKQRSSMTEEHFNSTHDPKELFSFAIFNI